ncbi:tetratricopeptide repeat protein [Legionella sp. WA2022007384]
MVNSFHLQGVEALNNAKYIQAKNLFLKAIKLNPEAAETYFFLGKTCFLADEIQEAISYLQQFIKLTQETKEQENQSNAFDLLGQCYAADNKDEIAITCYLNAIECDPSCVSVRHNLGLLYMKLAQGYLNINLQNCLTLLRHAQIALKSALELCNDNPMFLHSIASWYEQYIELLKKLSEDNSLEEMISKQFNHAIHYYLEAIAHCHQNDKLLHNGIIENLTECYAQFGHHLYNTQAYTEAQKLYTSALELDENHFTALNQLGMCLFKQGVYIEARTKFAAFFERTQDAQDKADALLNIACCYRLEKNWEKAEQSLDGARKLAPQDPEIDKENENLKQAKSQALLVVAEQAFFDPKLNNNSALSSKNTDNLQYN